MYFGGRVTDRVTSTCYSPPVVPPPSLFFITNTPPTETNVYCDVPPNFVRLDNVNKDSRTSVSLYRPVDIKGDKGKSFRRKSGFNCSIAPGSSETTSRREAEPPLLPPCQCTGTLTGLVPKCFVSTLESRERLRLKNV